MDLGNTNFWTYRYLYDPVAFRSSTMEMQDSNRQLKITLGGLRWSVGGETRCGTMVWTPSSAV